MPSRLGPTGDEEGAYDSAVPPVFVTAPTRVPIAGLVRDEPVPALMDKCWWRILLWSRGAQCLLGPGPGVSEASAAFM